MGEVYNLIEVKSKNTQKEFLQFPEKLYKNDPNWQKPLDIEVENLLSLKEKNESAFRWILQKEGGDTIGRIAAFYNPKSILNGEQAGGIGFFDCINNKLASFQLFDAAKNWLEHKGMKAMEGPTSPGMRDSFWGCLVDGFHEPVYNMPYNFPYYKDLFEDYGFRNYFNQYTYQRSLAEGGMHPAIRRRAERILQNPDYKVRMIRKGDQKFAADFKEIYNQAWADFSGVKEITEDEAINLLKAMEPVIDERLIYFCYYQEKPIAFFVMTPDIGQITRRFNGKWNWLTKLQFAYQFKKGKSINRVIGRIFGVIPEFQGRGVEGALVIAFEKEVLKPGFPYKTLELNWIGDFNPVMMKVCEFIGSSIYKTHVTYRYLFDQNQEFERAPMVNIKRK